MTSSMTFLLWVAIPYVSFTTFWVGHAWRYRTSQYSWTTRSSELFEQKLLRPGILLFHLGIGAVLIGHAVGLLIPQSVNKGVPVVLHAPKSPVAKSIQQMAELFLPTNVKRR